MRGWHGTILPLAAALAVTLLIGWPGGKIAAAREDHGQWTPTGLKGYTLRLFTPPSGALFATQTGGGVVRSDDAGVSWARVNLPPASSTPNAGRVFTLDPTNHTVMYASGEGGVYKTINDADSWTLILPTDEVMVNIAISPADPNVLYLATADKPVRDAKRIRLLRTQDGGASWDVLEELASNCLPNTSMLQPHPTDAGRIFRQQVCNPGGNVNGALAESRDFGSTWTKLLDRAGYRPTRVVGGRGVTPERLYSQFWNWTKGNNVLVRSNDDGATWSETTPPWAGLTLPPETESINLGGLDTDPTMADRLYAALNVNRAIQPPVTTTSFLLSRIMVSEDAGQSWNDLDFPGEAVVVDIKLGIDGQNLYAATGSGVWRLPIASGG